MSNGCSRRHKEAHSPAENSENLGNLASSGSDRKPGVPAPPDGIADGIGAIYAPDTVTSTVTIPSAVPFSVYGLGEFESAWGRGGSVQVLLLLSIAMSLAALVGSAIGASMAGRDRAVAKRLVLVAALVYLPLTYGALWLLGAIGSPAPVVLVWLVLGPGLISFALVRGAGTPGRRDAEQSDGAGREQ